MKLCTNITDMIKGLYNSQSFQNQIFICFQTIHVACTLLNFAPQAVIFFLHERFQLPFSFFPKIEKSLPVIVTFSTITTAKISLQITNSILYLGTGPVEDTGKFVGGILFPCGNISL